MELSPAQRWPDVDGEVRLTEALAEDDSDIRSASNGSLYDAADVIRIDDPFADELRQRPNNIAVLLPRYNEAPIIGKLVEDFQLAFPEPKCPSYRPILNCRLGRSE